MLIFVSLHRQQFMMVGNDIFGPIPNIRNPIINVYADEFVTFVIDLVHPHKFSLHEPVPMRLDFLEPQQTTSGKLYFNVSFCAAPSTVYYVCDTCLRRPYGEIHVHIKDKETRR